MPKSDGPASIVLILFGLLVAYESYRMPRFESIGGKLLNAPGLVPGSIGLVIALLGVVMLLRYLAASRRGQVGVERAPQPGSLAEEVERAEALEPHEKHSIGRMFAALVLSVLFGAVLVGNVPFWLAVFLFVFVFILYYERAALAEARSAVRTVVVAGLIAGATSFAVPFVFVKIFLVTLP